MGEKLEEKIKVYVYGLKEISGLDYVDDKSMGHPCVTGRGGDIYTGFKHLPVGSWNGYLPESQRKAVNIVREFCEENALEFEIVDIASLGFTEKMRIAFKKIRAPTIVFKEKKIEGVPTKEDLEILIAK